MAGGAERVLRRRIRSIQSTKKITRAMELIAASRIVRAQQAIAAARPYVEKIGEVVSHLATTPDGSQHPLFREPETVQRVAVIAIAGDRGLSGAYNSSIIRAADQVLRQEGDAGHETMLVAVGRKVINHFRYRHRDVAAAFTGFSDRPTPEQAQMVVEAVMGPFEAGELDRIILIHTHFVSLGTQRVNIRRLVPLDVEAPAEEQGGHRIDYEFEPDPADILDRLLPSWLRAEILAALLSASASEYAARQRAMKAATDNADDLITTLTRVMNRARQDAITTEIMEIVGGAEALRAAGGSGPAFHEIYEPRTQESA